MKWSYILDDKDTALTRYATSKSIEDKCTWQADTLEYILENYSNKSFRRCIDAGANYGFLTAGFARHFDKVDAFEISSDIRSHLIKNVKSFENVEVHNYGLYSKSSNVDFYFAESSGTSRIGTPKPNRIEKVIDLDSYNYTDVDLIKIDVEGSEHLLIQGAEKTIKQTYPVIVVEMHCTRDKRSFTNRQYIINFLYNLGYKIVDVRHCDFLFTKE